MGTAVQIIKLLALIGPEVPVIIQAIETLITEIEKAVTAGAGAQAFTDLKTAITESKAALGI